VAIPQSVRCPTCRKPTLWTGNPYRPFCSERCKLGDLGNWAAERYRIPGEKAPLPGEHDDDEDDE
jgi:endogenous inhibitor of DNA gyrase (YacG/DUF329 family)